MNRRGNASIEFALATPLVLMVLAGIVDGGLFMITRHAASRAARDGARVGAITTETPPADGSEIEANALAAAKASLVAGGYTAAQCDVDVRWWDDTDGRSWLTVRVEIQHTSIFGTYSAFSQDVKNQFIIYTQEQVN
jgi:Flp pilus assembly protein TadG